MNRKNPLTGEITSLTMAAIRRRTTADRPQELKACLDLYLDYFKGAPLSIEWREYEGVPSALIKPDGVRKPRVILCGHLDVVPGDDGQFEPRLVGDRLYGRGALDMKGSLSAMSAVVRKTAAKAFPWWLLIVSDEEVGGKLGAAKYIAEKWSANLFFAAEPSNLSLSLESKGALRLEIVHRGRKAHASTPWLGVSSVEMMMTVGPKIRLVIPEVMKEAWKTTACFTMIEGGAIINQVPDKCRLSLDIRYVLGDNPRKIASALRQALPGFEVRVLDTFPPMTCRKNTPYVLSLKQACRRVTGKFPALGREHGATDARYFSPRMDALIFGPSGADLHGSAEWVSLKSLGAFAQILEEWGKTIPA